MRYQNYVARYLPRFVAIPLGGLIGLGMQARDGLRRLREQDSPDHEWVDQVDPRMEQLWRSTPHGNGWLTIRDTTMLRWRFDHLPSTRRRYLLLSAIRGGDLSAWFACDTHVNDRHMLTVNDFWSTGGVRELDRMTVRALCRAAWREGFHSIELRFTGATAIHASWAAEGFVERSRQPFLVSWLNPNTADDVAGSIHITDIENDG